MKIDGCVALVTGANRGLGKAFVEALLHAGASRVFAGMRQPTTPVDARITPVRLDVTSAEDIAAAARQCSNVTLLINNAGVLHSATALAPNAAAALQAELAVNVVGLRSMMAAFAPVLARHGGGGILNVLSVVSWFSSPFLATYSASKHAALALTEAARIELRAQRTQVAGVFAGFIDTDMAADVRQPKVPPQQVAQRALAGLEQGLESVMADERSEQVWASLRQDPTAMSHSMQQSWDRHRTG